METFIEKRLTVIKHLLIYANAFFHLISFFAPECFY